jgi:hypothetical protein
MLTDRLHLVGLSVYLNFFRLRPWGFKLFLFVLLFALGDLLFSGPNHVAGFSAEDVSQMSANKDSQKANNKPA